MMSIKIKCYFEQRIVGSFKNAMMTKKMALKTNFVSQFFANSFIDGFIHLLFPSTCVVCEGELAKEEKVCCSICFSELHYTHYEKSKEGTSLDKLFWGRVLVESTYALLFYEKENNLKSILHFLKYKNRSDIGLYFGEQIGRKIKFLNAFSSVDVLVPVPLHKSRLYERGYNQSEKIAQGIYNTFGKPVDTKVVRRIVQSESQTKFGRFNRWDNVAFIFETDESIKKYNHVAIIDDVITTGATIEAIIQSIREKSSTIKISVISLAVTK